MRIDQFEQALDRYGGALTHWPEPQRSEAMALVASDAKAARLAANAARLDGLLAETMQPLPVDAALIGRIVSGIGAGAHRDAPFRPTPRFAAWAGVLMIAFLSAGYVAGVLLPDTQGDDALAGLMFGNSRTATDTDTGDTGSLL